MNLIEGDIIYSDYGKSPSPLQDYHSITVKKQEIIYRTWKISSRRIKSSPIEVKVDYNDFNTYWDLKNDIKSVFGKDVLAYIEGITCGHLDLFPRISENIINKILCYLDIEDLNSLSKVSKLFYKLCDSEDTWKSIFFKQYSLPMSKELQTLADMKGWKKLAFTNILQLRAQLVKLSKSTINDSHKDLQLAQGCSTMSLRNSLRGNKQPNVLRPTNFLKDSFSSFELDGAGDAYRGENSIIQDQEKTNNINLNNPANKTDVSIDANPVITTSTSKLVGKVDTMSEIKEFLEKFDVTSGEVLGSNYLDDTIADLQQERARLKMERQSRPVVDTPKKPCSLSSVANENSDNQKNVDKETCCKTHRRIEKHADALTHAASSSTCHKVDIPYAQHTLKDGNKSKIGRSYLNFSPFSDKKKNQSATKVTFPRSLKPISDSFSCRKSSEGSGKTNKRKEEISAVANKRQEINGDNYTCKKSTLMNVINPTKQSPPSKTTSFYESMSNDEVLMTKAAKNNLIMEGLYGHKGADDKTTLYHPHNH